ncbi:hypothetical protein D5F01_LYC23636 [Larimichthys crocea]|uniref:Uncharacterized protein n=1 Tax=Larimichthys crocea TaxID=215358 RepID=A0A6G0HI43_LARCR|nr:hypothetical protein D5F01_LYC23636 [Larimichthys crocea]
MGELLEIGKTLFFPNGRSSKGPIEDFEFDIRDYSHNILPSEITVGQLYDQTKLRMIRVYTTSKTVIALSDASDVESTDERTKNERASLEKALQGSIDETVEEDLLDVFVRMGSHCLPPKSNLRATIVKIAHKALLQEQKFIIDCFHSVLHNAVPELKSKDSIIEVYKSKRPTNRKVAQMIKPSCESLTPQEQTALNHLLRYPSILRKVGLAPTTVILYVGQAISFLEFFRSTPPTWELRKLHRDLGRTVLGHQALVKQSKGQKLIAREDLARCQALARAKMPSLLEDIEKAAPHDPRTRYRFFGYLAAYLSAIYGHRTGVLTRMRVKEAIGDDKLGYLINVMELKNPAVPTNPYFFTSLGRGEAKDLVRYFQMAWAEMGLKGAPSIMDNFGRNDSEVRQNLSSFMCHSASTQERFYALHKNLKRAKQIRELFVCLALEEGQDKTAAPPAAGPGEVEGDSKAEKPKKMAAAISTIVKKVKMTKSKDGGICPVCSRSFTMLAKHIRGRHMVTNQQYGSRITIPPGPCPMPGCRMLVLHVAKHLKGHRDITGRRKDEELAKLKRATAIAALARLRATNPQPPMATILDVEDPGEGSSTSQHHACLNPNCRKHCERMEKIIKRLQRRNAALRVNEVEEVEPARPPQQQQQQPPQQQQPSSSSSEEDEQPQQQPPQQQQPPEPATPQQPERTGPSSARRRLPFTPRPPQPSSSSSSSSSSEEEDKPAPPRQQQSRPRGTEKRKLPLSPDAPAESPWKKLGKTKHLSPEEESEEDDKKPKLGKVAQKVHRAMAPYFTGKSRGSKMEHVLALLDAYVEEYGQFIFCPEGTTKMQENAVSKISRAKVFLKYLTLGWSQVTYWTWEFLFNIPLLKCYPAVLRKAGLAPPPSSYMWARPSPLWSILGPRRQAPGSPAVGGGDPGAAEALKDLNRTVLGHQALIKQAKGKRLVAREDLARGHREGGPKGPEERYRFFGYLAAYLSSIYGHRMGVLTRMRVREVREAIGDDTTGYLINVMEHKTVRKFGTAQIFLEAEEYGWCRTWIRLRARAVPTNGFFFSSLGRGAKSIRELFVCLAVADPEQAAAAAGAAAAATEQPREESKGTPRKMLAAINMLAQKVKRKVGLSPSKPKRRPVGPQIRNRGSPGDPEQ